MSKNFSTISIQQLLELIFNDNSNNNIFGINSKLFYIPRKYNRLQLELFGQKIDTPLGVAAGPHTQMAQNIISAWLCGARYIELKTVQTLDELEISKPCIDMRDEGYNCEWSQELKIKESFNEYLNAWIVIHLLANKLGFGTPNTIFNMSVGYNYDGIQNDNVQWFLDKMQNCKSEKDEIINDISKKYPEIKSINIPDCISNNITLSTMHGCPADEIEKIGKYLLETKKLNLFVKLNPTLIGKEKLTEILNKTSKFKISVPDIAFEHDLKYSDAINIITNLKNTAKENNLFFGVKLTNTLETTNDKNVLPSNEKMIYMSGRALHPISVNLANKLQKEFNAELYCSFSAGADCFNIKDLISCNLKPVTVCSDILKPGGYGRLKQYIDNLELEFDKIKTESISYFIKNTANENDLNKAVLSNLENYSKDVLKNKHYLKTTFFEPNIKLNRKLSYFDCIKAPCENTCPTHQNIPDYMYLTSQGKFDEAFDVILKTNPFPNVLGMVCDHACQSKCTRINYDKSLLIREIKRFITSKKPDFNLKTEKDNGIKIAIIGAGPSGLSAAFFLRLAGFDINVYESKSVSGGMVSDVIPTFRLPLAELNKDISRIENLGVKITYNAKITPDLFEKLKENNQYIYIAVGAPVSKKMNIEGENCNGVTDSLKFLASAKQAERIELGNNVVIVGGGNSAMDSARMAKRLIKNNGNVKILYRRTINEMPAESEEIIAAINEGIEIIELVSPEKVNIIDEKLKSIVCSKMMLGEKDDSGRAKPIKINNSEFEIEANTIIVAIGQDVNIDFINKNKLNINFENYETGIKNVFIGGDSLRGASNIINAVADGRKVAEEIIKRSINEFDFKREKINKITDINELMAKKAFRNYGIPVPEPFLETKNIFEIKLPQLSDNEAMTEASRCLYCDELCSVCVTVCPNRANYQFEIEPSYINLHKAKKNNDKIEYIFDKVFSVNQKYQIINISDFCNECGNCTTFCPTADSPFNEKPKFHLTLKSFKKAEYGYYMSKLKDKVVLIKKEKNSIRTLTLNDTETYIYETEHFRATLRIKDFSIADIQFIVPCVEEAYLQTAAEMSILMYGAWNLY